MLDSPLIPNLLYLALVIGTWLAALAILSPGTGIIEVLAAVALGVGMIFFPCMRRISLLDNFKRGDNSS